FLLSPDVSATSSVSPLSLHDALPILIFIPDDFIRTLLMVIAVLTIVTGALGALIKTNIRRLFSYLIVCHIGFDKRTQGTGYDRQDRKSTRLNSSHVKISYAVFCLKKK